MHDGRGACILVRQVPSSWHFIVLTVGSVLKVQFNVLHIQKFQYIERTSMHFKSKIFSDCISG